MKLLLPCLALLCMWACQPQSRVDLPSYSLDMRSANELADMKNNFKKYIQCFPGHYRSLDQLDKDPDMISRDMVSIRVFENQTDEIWTYTEIFPTNLPTEPLIQIFHKHTRLSRDTFLIEPYMFLELNRMDEFLNEWKKDKHFVDVELDELAALPHCGLRMVVDGQRCFRTIKNDGAVCPMPLEGRAYYTEIGLTYYNEKVLLETAYYDKEKNYLGSSNEGGTIYNRLSKKELGKSTMVKAGK